MSKTLGLALGSGGSRGIAHIGFLQALDEEGIKPDFVAGCSMGAVVGGGYASGLTPEELKKMVFSLKKHELFDLTPNPISHMGLLRSKKLYELLKKRLKKSNIEEFDIPFKCVATDLLSGTVHVFESGDAATAIQASSSVPALFRPVKLEDKLLVDGGCLCRVPVRIVKEMGADVVIAVDVLKNCSEPVDNVKNILALLLRVFDVIEAKNANSLKVQVSDICDLWLEPEISGMSQYKIKNLKPAYDEGYALGKANVQKIKELLK